ncbi:MAG: sulfur oxidation c-type cytochrome SoxX [Gemmatimonadota bacterium]
MKARFVTIAAGALALAGCASLFYTPPSKEETLAVIKSSFHDRGIAKVDRLNQSQMQAICSDTHNNPSAEQRAQIERAAQVSVKYPSDGNWLGDYKHGERIAQTGVGLQWSDKPGKPAGGNCYACHQLSKAEISYGNIGPSLYHYGKLRGDTEQTRRYTWAKIWNTHAFNACSPMPRFGDAGILTEAQIKDVMALLLDPASPVNQ